MKITLGLKVKVTLLSLGFLPSFKSRIYFSSRINPCLGTTEITLQFVNYIQPFFPVTGYSKNLPHFSPISEPFKPTLIPLNFRILKTGQVSLPLPLSFLSILALLSSIP